MQMTGYKYIASGGQTFDTIAMEMYGDEKYAADLMCANPELATKAFFTGGEGVRLPEVDLPVQGEESQPVTAPWRV